MRFRSQISHRTYHLIFIFLACFSSLTSASQAPSLRERDLMRVQKALECRQKLKAWSDGKNCLALEEKDKLIEVLKFSQELEKKHCRSFYKILAASFVGHSFNYVKLYEDIASQFHPDTCMQDQKDKCSEIMFFADNCKKIFELP